MLDFLKRSLMSLLNSKVCKTDPCGTPEETSECKEKMSKMRKEDCRLER